MTALKSRVIPILAAAPLLLALASPALAEASIRGTTKDANGKPIEGVEITLTPSDPSFSTLTAKSNKKGRFVVGLIRPSNYRLVAKLEGMRISRIDANIAIPEDDSLWDFRDEVPQGAETPEFQLTGLSTMTYDIQFVPHVGDIGVFGTGLPVSQTKVIIDLLAEGKNAEATEVVKKNLEKDPDSATYNYLHAFVLRAEGNYDEALAAVDKALAADPGFEGANLLKGKTLEEKGDLEASIEFYRLEADTAGSEQVQTDALLSLAIVHEQMEHLPEAVAALERLVEIAPDHANAYKELADLYIRLGDPEKASEMMDQVISLGAQDPDLLYNLGAKAFNDSDFEAAANYFTKVIEAAPDYKDAYLRLAYTQLNQSDREGAAQNLEKYIELSSEDDPEAQTARAILQQLQK